MRHLDLLPLTFAIVADTYCIDGQVIENYRWMVQGRGAPVLLAELTATTHVNGSNRYPELELAVPDFPVDARGLRTAQQTAKTMANELIQEVGAGARSLEDAVRRLAEMN